MARIAWVELAEAALPCSMAASTVARSLAVAVLLRPFWYALPSSTPRSTVICLAPRVRKVPVTRLGSTSAMTEFVARLLERVIIRWRSSRAGTGLPMRS
jgi:hypothetical protein